MKKLAVLIASICMFIPAIPTQAHVLESDEAGQSGIVVHTSPDDDPIAGDKTDIYIDIQNPKLNTKDYVYELEVTDDNGVTEGATMYVLGEQSIGASYIFSRQGNYDLLLVGRPVFINNEDGEAVEFRFTQAVNRGISAEETKEDSGNKLLLAGLFALTILAGGLTIFMVVRSKS